MSEQLDCVVIGAGVIGLAVARALARAGREVVVLESEDAVGTGTSSRNSEVIHAGIYYSTGSLKASLCVAGKQQLYRFCSEAGVEHRRVGKLIVATSQAEVATLAKYEAQARANGVELQPISIEHARELEPEVRCVAALYSESTGIIDSHGLMQAYLAEIEARRGVLVLESPVTGGCVQPDHVVLEVGGSAAVTVRAASVVNCAGLGAQSVSNSLRGVPPAAVPARYLAKGHYFSLSGRSPFRHLVYPVANSAGLGTHVTLDLQGQARFGPDVKWVEEIDYGFDLTRRAAFAEAIRLYYPGLSEDRLVPAYTGIRPKITAPDAPAADFCIRGRADHSGCPYVALYGIESPGLTASLAIAEQVAGALA